MSTYKQGSRPTIGVLSGWHTYTNATLTSFQAPLLRGIYAAAKKQACNLLISCGIYHDSTLHHPGWPVMAPDVDFVPVGPWNTDGMLVVTDLIAPARSAYVQQLTAAGFPVVYIGTGENGPTIVADNTGGIHQAVGHLHAHGHRQIAFIGGRPIDRGEGPRRLDAFRAAMQRFNLETQERLIVYGHFNEPGGYQAMQTLLRTALPFTAVITGNDESAKGALQALREAGRRVPEDVALIGFDDQLDARAQTPPLTTIHQPIFEIGEQALQWLVTRLHGLASSVTYIEMPTRLVVRNSCGCQPESMLTVSPASSAYWAALEPAQFQSQLAQAMGEAVLAEARQLSAAEVYGFCQRLCEAFVQSLRRTDAAPFRAIYLAVLQEADMPEDDAYIWYPALAVLENNLAALLEACRQTEARRFAEMLLLQARNALAQHLRWQHTRDLVEGDSLLDELGQFTSQLSITLDEQRIFEITDKYLPRLGIKQGQVFFYEPEEGDAYAWSVLPRLAATTARYPLEAQRFLSQAFPPPGIYPADQPFHLALLPLHLQETLVGFVAFEAGNLMFCAFVVRQLASALGSARLHNTVVEGRRKAEEADRLKSRFLSMVSHELRTPLSLVAGLSDMLLQDEALKTLPAASRRDIEQIHQGAQHLDRLLRDVLDLASSQVGQLRLEAAPMNLREAFQVVLATGERLAQAKGLAWHAEFSPDLPRVWGDRTRLRQVALNFISNAVKFTDRGQISLRVTADAQTVKVAVRDTGLGIEPDEQAVIFDEFRQSERTAARGYGGMGLGLAISKRVIEMHGGTIGVHSSGQEGEGATFYFTLPALQKVDTLPQVLTSAMQTITVLAQTAEAKNPLLERLAGQGYKVQALPVSMENTAWLMRLAETPPGALLLDLPLAAARGGEMLRALKSNMATRTIPILFYNLADDGQAGAVLELDCLPKPIEMETMTRVLERQGLLPGEAGPAVNILLVDDDPAILEMYARMVQKISPACRVLRAANGREALVLLRQSLPALVLLDLRMPELDGFGVLQAMRQNALTRHVPVIVLTAQSLTVDDMARLNDGVATVLTKDMFSLEEVTGAVQRVLNRQARLGGEGQRLVRQLMAYIHQHFAESLTPEILSGYVNVSESYLFQIFRTELGVTPMAYLNRYRIARAKDLLTTTPKRITEISFETGFSDSAYFARVFQRETGVSPSAFRQGKRHLN